MIAFSSAAQIGYIFVGIGTGTMAGMVAAIFQIFVHAVTKPIPTELPQKRSSHNRRYPASKNEKETDRS